MKDNTAPLLLPLFRRSLANCEKTLGENHPYVARVLEDIAVLLRETNQADEAELVEKRAAAIRAMKP